MDILRHHQSPKIKQNGEKIRENATPLFFQKIQRYTLKKSKKIWKKKFEKKNLKLGNSFPIF